MHSQASGSRTLRALWNIGPFTSRGPRPRFTLDEIADTAVSLADSESLGGVSLAAVATRLGLTTTALYRYVDSKDTLVELMVDTAVGPVPDLGGDGWHARVQTWTRELCGRYRHHPWLAGLHVAGMPRTPRRLAWIDRLLYELDDGGVRDPMHIALLLDGLARNFALLAPPGSPPPVWLHEAASTHYPRLAQELERDWADIDDELTRATDTVLRGAGRAE